MHGLIPEPFTISILEAVVEDMTGTSIPHLIPGHKKKKTEKDPADSKRLAATQVARPFLAVVLQAAALHLHIGNGENLYYLDDKHT